MIDLLQLLASGLGVLAAACIPSAVCLRILGADRLMMLGLAPALGAAAAGIAAILAAGAGIRWGVLPLLAAWALLLLIALLLRRAGARLPSPASEADGSPYDPRRPLLILTPGSPVSLPAALLAMAALMAIGPIARAFGSPGAILQRWDTLYHLSALARIRETGDGSSLTLGALSNTAGRAVAYPAAFHDLSSLIPGVPIPILLNAAVLVLAVLPWTVGIALLARVVWPQHRWGPLSAAIVALLAPAAPLNEWVHLSPIPNLVGFSMTPGLLAAATLLWRALAEEHAPAPLARTGEILASLLVLAAGGAGLALLQPNCAVMALLLLAALTGTSAVAAARRRPAGLLVPLILLAPVALLLWTPLGAMVTSFTGGLVVPWWTAAGEVALGLLTVWPMALGVVLAVLWWPGLVSAWRSPGRWITVGWILVAVLYLDAAVDSSLDLSILFYRGQDRLSMPLTMLSSVLVVPGLAAWARAVRWGRVPRAIAAIAAVAAVAVAGASVPTRLDHARLNAQLDLPGRNRFLQVDELAAFAAAAPSMDREGIVLASPFSGASHLYAMTGQSVMFPVAGMSTTADDVALLDAAGTAAIDPAACRLLVDAGVRYVYEEDRPYQHAESFQRLNRADERLGPLVLETSHSRMYEVACDDGR